MPGYFNAIGECFKCDFSCKTCSLDANALLTATASIKTQVGSLKTALEGDADTKLQEEGAKIPASATTSFYEQ